MEYKEVYESWLANPYFDEATKQELLSIKDDENEIKERFYADLEFGTAVPVPVQHKHSRNRSPS